MKNPFEGARQYTGEAPGDKAKSKANGEHKGEEQAADGPTPNPFKFHTADLGNGPVFTGIQMIKDVLMTVGVGNLYGRPGCGKSFVALDIGLHVAAGMEWRGHKVRQCGVLHMSMEAGPAGVNRVYAWLYHHKISWPEQFYMSPVLFNMRTPRQSRELVEEICKRGWKIGLLIVDTLAKALAGGNENSSEDMGAVIANAEWIMQELGCFVLFIHHSGKDVSKGARGHSSLLGAVNTEMELTRERGCPGVLTVKKQRDSTDDAEFGFDLKYVSLGQDEDGDDVGSCVAVEIDGNAAPKASSGSMPDGARTALKALVKTLGEVGRVRDDLSFHIPRHVATVTTKEWRDHHARMLADKPAKTISKAFERGRDWLQAHGFVGCWDAYTWKVQR